MPASTSGRGSKLQRETDGGRSRRIARRIVLRSGAAAAGAVVRMDTTLYCR